MAMDLLILPAGLGRYLDIQANVPNTAISHEVASASPRNLHFLQIKDCHQSIEKPGVTAHNLDHLEEPL